MKNIIFALSFSAFLAFAPAIQASVTSTKSLILVGKEDGKKKKKKSCDSASKEECAKGQKSCCKKKEGAAVQ